MERGLWLLAVTASSLVREDGRWRQPVNEMGESCPWPFDPISLRGAPLGQYHCGYCGAMVMAGMAHIDYAEMARVEAQVS